MEIKRETMYTVILSETEMAAIQLALRESADVEICQDASLYSKQARLRQREVAEIFNSCYKAARED